LTVQGGFALVLLFPSLPLFSFKFSIWVPLEISFSPSFLFHV
jgi:hypothetical protein